MAQATERFILAFARHSSAFALAWILALFAGATGAQDGPRRVVSINLCTDQLAMMIAAPGQLVSVSYLARDPMASVMTREAMDYPTNRARAEDIFVLRPDLVLGGDHTTPATVAMLRRLDVPVESFPIAVSLQGIVDQIRRMGVVLGQEGAAEDLIATFEADLARLRARGAGLPPRRAAIYGASGYTSGTEGLAAEMFEIAALDNIAGDVGMRFGGVLPLEKLVLIDPDLVITATEFSGHSRAEEILSHPVLRDMIARRGQAKTDPSWVCGLPQVTRAIAGLLDTVEAMQ